MASKDIPQFRQDLSSWFKMHHRKLPWRETNDPYRIWVSEVMLQQTQVKKVLGGVFQNRRKPIERSADIWVDKR
jgi:adenine-specific DNA glycosylase